MSSSLVDIVIFKFVSSVFLIRFFDDCEEERAKLAERKAKFLLMLEEKYTSSLAQTSCSREEEAVEPVKVIKDSQEENMSVPSNVTCTEELLAWFQEHYEAFVSGLAQEVEVSSCTWNQKYETENIRG